MTLALYILAFAVLAVAAFILWINLKHRSYLDSLPAEERAREVRFLKNM